MGESCFHEKRLIHSSRPISMCNQSIWRSLSSLRNNKIGMFWELQSGIGKHFHYIPVTEIFSPKTFSSSKVSSTLNVNFRSINSASVDKKKFIHEAFVPDF